MKVPTQLVAAVIDFAIEHKLPHYYDEVSDTWNIDADPETGHRTVCLTTTGVEDQPLALSYYMDTDEAGMLTFSEHIDLETFREYLEDWRKGDPFVDVN